MPSSPSVWRCWTRRLPPAAGKLGAETAAAAVALGAGLGFGIPDLFGIRHFADTGRVWMFLGFPTYGDGPFERIGIRTSVPLLTGLLGVCAAEIVLGVLIWKRSPVAKTLSRALLPVEFAAWLGFALPLGPVLSLGRVALLERAEGPGD